MLFMYLYVGEKSNTHCNREKDIKSYLSLKEAYLTVKVISVAETTDLYPHLRGDKVQLYSVPFSRRISCSDPTVSCYKNYFSPALITTPRRKPGLIGIVLVCQRGLRPSPSLCVYLHQCWSASHSSVQKGN